eukprot:TRINITY_DN6080_c0_g1_i3.p2 TRINITY_DN6080_c0_g1~~TRINITY_DN6080_c0_g1_i3.p2  ORF type:complete len:396 (+),score=34.62 TRINITY_DN6080_c0_g1_i3:28-1188(+)
MFNLNNNSLSSNYNERVTWAFSSSGWLYIYFLGVVKCLKQLKLTECVYAVGSSGGAAASSTIFLDVDEQKLLNYVFECVEKARSSIKYAFCLREYMKGACSGFLHEGAHERLIGNIEFSVTKLAWLQNLRIKYFKDNKEAEQAILSSTCLVPLAGLPIWMDGVGYVMDGVFSDVNLVKAWLLGDCLFELNEGKNSITVCPFYCSRADIKPSKYIPIWWALYPPQVTQMQKLFDLGFYDALNYLSNPNNLMHQILIKQDKIPDLQVLRQQAKQRVSKQSSFEQDSRSPKFPLNLLIDLCWLCILMELIVMLLVSGGLAIFASAVPKTIDPRGQYVRFTNYLQSLISIQVLAKAIPAVGSYFQFPKEAQIGEQLHSLSVLYRFLYFFL